MDRIKIDISKIHLNDGQIEHLPKNPRFIKDDKFEKLCKSIQSLPELTEARDLLVYPYNGSYVVIGGNMRLRAYRELGWNEVPCCVLPVSISVEKLREIIIQDNNSFGEIDWNIIADEWDIDDLRDWGVDLPKEWDVNQDDYGESFNLPDGDKNPIQQMTFTFADKQAELVKSCIEKIIDKGLNFETFGNENKNGNALYEIIRQWDELKK